jgi:hypothetical protein
VDVARGGCRDAAPPEAERHLVPLDLDERPRGTVRVTDRGSSRRRHLVGSVQACGEVHGLSARVRRCRPGVLALVRLGGGPAVMMPGTMAAMKSFLLSMVIPLSCLVRSGSSDPVP